MLLSFDSATLLTFTPSVASCDSVQANTCIQYKAYQHAVHLLTALHSECCNQHQRDPNNSTVTQYMLTCQLLIYAVNIQRYAVGRALEVMDVALSYVQQQQAMLSASHYELVTQLLWLTVNRVNEQLTSNDQYVTLLTALCQTASKVMLIGVHLSRAKQQPTSVMHTLLSQSLWIQLVECIVRVNAGQLAQSGSAHYDYISGILVNIMSALSQLASTEQFHLRSSLAYICFICDWHATCTGRMTQQHLTQQLVLTSAPTTQADADALNSYNTLLDIVTRRHSLQEPASIEHVLAQSQLVRNSSDRHLAAVAVYIVCEMCASHLFRNDHRTASNMVQHLLQWLTQTTVLDQHTQAVVHLTAAQYLIATSMCVNRKATTLSQRELHAAEQHLQCVLSLVSSPQSPLR